MRMCMHVENEFWTHFLSGLLLVSIKSLSPQIEPICYTVRHLITPVQIKARESN